MASDQVTVKYRSDDQARNAIECLDIGGWQGERWGASVSMPRRAADWLRETYPHLAALEVADAAAPAR